MSNQLEKYKRYGFMGIIMIALGVSFSTTMKNSLGALGTVFIAIGGLFLIIAMNMKSKNDKGKK